MGTKNIKRRCAGCDNLLTGRSDKKFCTAKCTSSHHNERKRAGEYLSTTDGVEVVTDLLNDSSGELLVWGDWTTEDLWKFEKTTKS